MDRSKQQIESVANAEEEYVGVVLVASQLVRSAVFLREAETPAIDFVQGLLLFCR
jgi:hypothetical protein